LVANGSSVQHILDTSAIFCLGYVQTRAMIGRQIGAKKAAANGPFASQWSLGEAPGLMSGLI